MSFAFVFPGQGSQSVGMMSAYAEEYPLVRQLFEEASDQLSVDLWALTQSGPEDQLALTENTQPALLTAGYATWRIWQELGGSAPSVMAGHSLGEFTALLCAGALQFSDAVTLVRDRGRYMQDAVPAGEGAMAAVIGLDDDDVVSACAKYASEDVLQAVNFNAPGQVVVAGSAGAVARLSDAAGEIGARRIMPLPVSIPAHSSLMTPAAEALATRLETIEVSVPEIPVVHNFNVSVAGSAEEVCSNLVGQANSPVRWVETIRTILEGGATTLVESGPGRVLGGMIKRIDREASVLSLDDVASVPEAIDTTG